MQLLRDNLTVSVHLVNPLHPKVSLHILLTVLYTFPMDTITN